MSIAVPVTGPDPYAVRCMDHAGISLCDPAVRRRTTESDVQESLDESLEEHDHSQVEPARKVPRLTRIERLR